MSYKFKFGDRVVIKDVDRANKFCQELSFCPGASVFGSCTDTAFTITQRWSFCAQKQTNLYSAKGYGWIEEDNLVLEEDYFKKKYRKILIMQDEAPFDNVVKARDVYSGEEAEAVCAPSDTFDFATGAKIAFDRLMEKQTEKTYYSGKVVCYANLGAPHFTVGKVYTVKNGSIVTDFNLCVLDNVKSVEDLNNKLLAQFIEYKGEKE